MTRPVLLPFRCCLITPDPGSWKAGVDDSADPRMLNAMHDIQNRLSYDMPIDDFVWALKAASQLDIRTVLGWRIHACLLSNAAHRLEILAMQIDPWPWRNWTYRLKDAWAVWRGRAVVTHLSTLTVGKSE